MVDVTDTTYEVMVDDTTYNVDVTVASISGTLNNMSDVVITSPTNNQALAYQASTETWINATGAGSGDMTKAVYDPTTIEGDAFDMDNMVEGTALILSAAERTKIGNLDTAAYTASTDYAVALTSDQNYVTDTQLVVIGNTSGANSGDQDLSSYAQYTATQGIVPDTDESYDLGSATHKWNTLYLAGSTIYLGTETLTSDDASNVGNLDTAAYTASTVYAAALGADDNYVTDAELVVVQATSNTNTGDMSNADVKTAYEANANTNAVTDAEKTVLGNTSGSNSGDQAASDFNHDDLANITGTASQYNHPTDANMTVIGNTSGSNSGDQAASDFNHDDLANLTGTAAQYNHPTDANMTVLGNTSGTNSGDITNLTSFTEQTAFRVFYSDTAGDVTELALGADGTFLKSNGAAANPTFAVPAGSGDVSKDGTPDDNQVGVWTGDGTIEGTSTLTYDGALNVVGNITTTGTVDGIDIATDVAANTLKNTNVPTALSVGTVGINTVAITSDGGADDVTLPAALVDAAGMLTTAKWGEIVANNAKNTNVPTALSTGTVDGTTYGITSDSGADDVVLVAATTNAAGLLTAALFDEIDANTDKVTNASHTGDVTGDGALTIAAKAVDVAMLADGTDGELITWSATGVADTVDVGTATHVLTSNGVGAAPTFQAAASGGISWSEVTDTSQAAAVDNGYICNNAALVTVTIPTTAAVGSVVRVCGKGAGGWKIAQNASELIYFGNTVTTTGDGGSLASSNDFDAVELVCITANTAWTVVSSVGNITVV